MGILKIARRIASMTLGIVYTIAVSGFFAFFTYGVLNGLISDNATLSIFTPTILTIPIIVFIASMLIIWLLFGESFWGDYD